MKVKTSELTGAALNWAVAMADGAAWAVWRFMEHRADGHMRYSTDWAQGEPIIEREGIDVDYWPDGDYWQATSDTNDSFGPTPLIAAMRCYVASKLGDEIDVPDALASSQQP